MKKLNLSILLCLVLTTKFLFAQSSSTVREYIAQYKDIAISEMLRTGVPASITLAQGIHETEAGQSDLVRRSNNHFGIKCKEDWNGERVYHDDDARGECFRKYDDPAQSYKDHSDFLKNRPHYASLFKLDPTDYEAWAYGLRKAGYATNPQYAHLLIKIIKDYDLQQYTMMALNKKISVSDTQMVVKANVESNRANDNNNPVSEVKQNSYPEGIFKLNETQVVYVPKGISFLAIAEKFSISLPRLFEYNDMKPQEVTAKDQLIYLQRKRKTGINETHRVAAGETIYDIAQAEGIRLDDLLEYNSLKADMQPETGEILQLNHKGIAMPRLVRSANPVAATTSAKYIIHVVQPKETLYAIGKKYDVSAEDIMQWNNLPTTDLKPGQSLRINKQ